MKGPLTAKQLAELLNINRKTVFKMAMAQDASLAFALGLPSASMPDSSSIGYGSRDAEGILG